MGETGEYSDNKVWLVKAFTDIVKAEEFVVILNQECTNLKQQMKNGDLDHWEMQGKNKYDSNFEMDYTGTEYYYKEIILD